MKRKKTDKKGSAKIASEIHDQFLPNLMSIIYELEFWEKTAPLPPDGRKFLRDIKTHLDAAVGESRKFLLFLKPPRIIESSLPKALNHYLLRLAETKGLKYRWVTPTPDKQTYVSQDILLMTFLELLANLPMVAEEILFRFCPDEDAVTLSFSWGGLSRAWLSKELKNVILKRLVKAKGKIRYRREGKRLWLEIFLPQR